MSGWGCSTHWRRDLALVAELRPRRDDLREVALDRRSALLDLRQRRVDGMAAELARSLTPGGSCPVCGAVEHPHPAELADPVLPDDVHRAEDDLALAETALGQVDHELSALLARADTRRAALGDATRAQLVQVVEGTTADLARARRAVVEHDLATRRLDTATSAVEAHRRELAGLVATGEAVAAQVAELAEADEAAADRVSALRDEHDGCPCGSEDPEVHGRASRALGGHRAAVEALAAARARSAAASDALAAALSAAGFDDEGAARNALLPEPELTRLRTLVTRHVEDLAGARAVADDPEVIDALASSTPDLVALASAARTARDALLAAAAAQDDASRALRGVERLLPLVEEACAAVVLAATRDARVRDLADTTSGTGPDNTLRMRLTAYVLAARLEKVATLANERLAVMGGGRYVLEHSDERAARGARSGLGLRVLDQWTGRVRDTATLSGGESFMASLALALGLADAVREETGGLDLGTLFIDEGFGSLDDDSLEQVLTVLDVAARGRAGRGRREPRRRPARPGHPPGRRAQGCRRQHRRGARRRPGGRARRLSGGPDLRGRSVLERLRRGARADEVAVAVGAVDAAHRRPVLVGRVDADGERGGATVVGVVPLAGERLGRVRGVPQHAVGDGDRRPSRPRRSRARIAIIASQNRSISSLSSLSVGSTMSVPATGKDIVGAWKP